MRLGSSCQLLNFMALRPGAITRSGVHDNSGRLLVGPGG